MITLRFLAGILIVVALNLIAFVALSQSFVMERDLGPVQTDGFYRIDLSPDIMSNLNAALTNARIIDSNGKEVPYLLMQEQPATYSKIFRPYRISSYDKVKNCCTSIILENPDSKPINNIHLSIRNADVSKTITLTASDDKKEWYALKAPTLISATGDGTHTSALKLVDFPMSNYAFYKIDIDDSTSAPLSITAAGYFALNTSAGKYSNVTVDWQKSDSASLKRSYIKLRFSNTQVIDRIVLAMKGTPYFLRRGNLLREVKSSNARKPYYDRLASFTVSSRQPAVIDLNAVRGNEFILEIENEDNPSLEVDNLSVEQLNRYLVAWLSKGEHKLMFGKPELQAPNYDLQNFRDSIPASLQQLKPGAAKSIKEEQASETPTFFTNRLVIWAAIIVVIGVLGLLAVKMTREM